MNDKDGRDKDAAERLKRLLGNKKGGGKTGDGRRSKGNPPRDPKNPKK